MPVRNQKARRLPGQQGRGPAMDRRLSREAAFGVIAGDGEKRNRMPSRGTNGGNDYLCAIERNQNGKYNVRIRAFFPRGNWRLFVYFLASSFDKAMKKLEESLQVLQKNEERMRFWSIERSDDPNVAGDLLEEFGLWLDRRAEFPRKAAEVGAPFERLISASMLAPVRRTLAETLAQERSAIASD